MTRQASAPTTHTPSHTPGPWMVTPNARADEDGTEGFDYMVRQCDGDGEDTYTIAMVDEATNARLIARAAIRKATSRASS